ncbi:MAG: PLP-dependent transferase, partial [Desulfovibrio sp.]|nr:PLP-dependent transferase [Desulfovibrio sp.]
MKEATKCLHAGYSPKNGEPRVVPIVQSTTYVYDATEQVARLFDLEESGFFYSRIGNPTVDAVEQKIAALEGGVGALCTSSGQAAVMLAALNLARAGDHIVSATNVYGGTFNLFNTIFKRFGIETTFVDQSAPDGELAAAFRPNTRFVFGETIANPALSVLDIERFARLAHERGLPLLVDNTFATPILCRPFEFGADVVVHSTTKYMDGHAVQLGGVIVDSGNFDWSAGAFPEFAEPDPSYHGLVYAEAFGRAAYIAKARVQLMRDLGCCQSAQGAFYTNLGLETLPLRMQKHSENAEAAAHWLAGQDKVEWVRYPRLT